MVYCLTMFEAESLGIGVGYVESWISWYGRSDSGFDSLTNNDKKLVTNYIYVRTVTYKKIKI